MLCPTCKVELKMSERQGVEIDYCPQCRGVWLDRGELDKIIDRVTAQTAGSGPSGYLPSGTGAGQPGYPPPATDPYAPGWRRDDDDRRDPRRRRRRGWFDDLFDFD